MPLNLPERASYEYLTKLGPAACIDVRGSLTNERG